MEQDNKIRKKVFVTVGTTRFDGLVNQILEHNVLKELKNKSYTEMIIQAGQSHVDPDKLKMASWFGKIEYFKYASSLQSYILSADLVIGHGGAGTCMEVLEAKKPLIVVDNHDLMNSHQTELAQQLSRLKYLYWCECESLADFIGKMNLSELETNFQDKSYRIAETIDQIMGF